MATKGKSMGGVSPRKEMAGALSSGNFGVKSFSSVQNATGIHPDRSAGTGRKGHMADHERGIGMPVSGKGKGHPSQAAPDHGPTHPGGYGVKRY